MRKSTAIKELNTKAPNGRYLRAEIRLILPALCSNLTDFESRNFSINSQFSTVLESVLVNEGSYTRCHLCSEDSNDAERR